LNAFFDVLRKISQIIERNNIYHKVEAQ